MIRFVHAADIHLDSPLVGLSRYEGAPVERLRGATRQALARLVEFVIAEEVPLLLIAGDVYDGDWQDFNTGLHFNSQMIRLGRHGVTVVMIHGNHDADNVMTRRLPLPENVRVLDHRKPQTLVLEELGVAVHGQSFATKAVSENLAAGYPQARPDLFNIGLLHTALGTPGYDPYAPCSMDDLLAKQYEYWALGHVHEHAVLHTDPHVVFAGCLQGRHVREPGAKGCVLVEAEGRRVSTRFEPMDVVRWDTAVADVAGAAEPEEAVSIWRGAFEQALERAGSLALACRAVLTGNCAAHAALQKDAEGAAALVQNTAAEASRGSAWIEKVLVETGPEIDFEELARSDTPQGDLLRFVEQCADDAEAFAQLEADLTPLTSKIARTGASLPDLDDPEERRRIMREVRDIVLPRLTEQGEG
ncbi:metallophosphoesterase family protein [Oceanidesulfovibrio marinus]|uniref:DNA repair exonuclease n=1 Tax=Oceanidesulfovibrio marinus TaxID=370038 RepID=A0A6P1ZJY0_9BACT|nr:DNA repair exonuclease [Oceanidesulfovibrio marinus]TVM33657.1 DNA repair exonuclease [Oceanidesulfovibrio marinus]